MKTAGNWYAHIQRETRREREREREHKVTKSVHHFFVIFPLHTLSSKTIKFKSNALHFAFIIVIGRNKFQQQMKENGNGKVEEQKRRKQEEEKQEMNVQSSMTRLQSFC